MTLVVSFWILIASVWSLRASFWPRRTSVLLFRLLSRWRRRPPRRRQTTHNVTTITNITEPVDTRPMMMRTRPSRSKRGNRIKKEAEKEKRIKDYENEAKESMANDMRKTMEIKIRLLETERGWWIQERGWWWRERGRASPAVNRTLSAMTSSEYGAARCGWRRYSRWRISTCGDKRQTISI